MIKLHQKSKSYRNILINGISYKTSIGAKSLTIRFDEVSRFVRVYGKTRYLVLFGPEKYDVIYNRIIIIQKSGIDMLFLIIMQESKLIHLILYV